MPGITLQTAEERLELWLAADAAVAGGQSYTITTATGSRSLTRADVAEIRKQVDYWNGWVRQLSAGTTRTRFAVFERRG
ncbi:MAG: hypothetical protein AcusKO_29430 [Acuticoccus sp.]